MGRARRSASRPRCATRTSSSAAAGPRAERRPVPMKVAYHDACHLAHAQKRARRSRASCCARSPSWSWSSRASGSCAAARPGSTTWSSPSPPPSWASARRATCSTPAPRPSPRPTPAAPCRSRRTPSAWARAAGAAPDGAAGAVDRGRLRPCPRRPPPRRPRGPRSRRRVPCSRRRDLPQPDRAQALPGPRPSGRCSRACWPCSRTSATSAPSGRRTRPTTRSCSPSHRRPRAQGCDFLHVNDAGRSTSSP